MFAYKNILQLNFDEILEYTIFDISRVNVFQISIFLLINQSCYNIYSHINDKTV